MTTTLKACVIGHPIAHSRSPLIHSYWLKQMSIDGQYEKQDVAPEDLQNFFLNLEDNNLRGCNITIPHKEHAIKFVDDIDDTSSRIGSINTVWLENRKRRASTTDGIGFCTNIEQSLKSFSFKDKRVVVVGAGGSTRPIVAEMINRGAAEIIIANRNLGRAQDIARIFANMPKAIPLDELNRNISTADLLVNTTSIGLHGETEYPADLMLLPESAVVTDIVYAPLETQLLKNAKTRNLTTVTGLGMLLHQAVYGFEKWFGQTPTVTEELYKLVAADLQKAQL